LQAAFTMALTVRRANREHQSRAATQGLALIE
jgi:hypothetical protein